MVLFFCCNDAAPSEIYTYSHTLSLHDALPSLRPQGGADRQRRAPFARGAVARPRRCDRVRGVGRVPVPKRPLHGRARSFAATPGRCPGNGGRAPTCVTDRRKTWRQGRRRPLCPAFAGGSPAIGDDPLRGNQSILPTNQRLSEKSDKLRGERGCVRNRRIARTPT